MNIKVDTRAASAMYSQAFQRLAALPGFNTKDILRAEAGVILKTWAGRTKVATQDSVERRLRARVAHNLKMQKVGGDNPYGITVNNGARGGTRGEVWFRTAAKRFQQAGIIDSGDGYVPAWTHWKTQDWQRINAGALAYANMLKARRKAALDSAAFTRQSIIQIADSLGIDLTQVKGGGTLSAAGIAKARAAIASSGRAYQNGVGFQGGDDIKAYVQLINRLPYGAKAGIDRTLIGIVFGRAKYIEQSYAKGAFDSISSVARAFPNLRVNTSLN